MRHLLIVTSSYATTDRDTSSGAGVFVRDFARSVAACGVGVAVVTSDRKATRPADDGVETILYRWSGGTRPALELSLARPSDVRHVASLLIGGILAIRRVARHLRPDRCLCMWAVPSGAMAHLALRGMGVPRDVWCLGSDIWRYGRHPATRWLVRATLRHAALLFADGPGLAAEVSRLAGRACRFLPSARQFVCLPAGRHPVAGKPNLLFIGRFHPNKGVDLLPEMMAHLVALGFDAHIHLFGGGLLEARVLSLIEQHCVADRVSLHGFCDAETAATWMARCDALIVPSRIESVPVVFSDAVACGIPLVAADVGDLGTMVQRYGLGETCRPDDPRDLAEAVVRVLANGREAYRRGLDEARALFDIQRIAREYLEIAAGGPCPAP